MNIRKIDPTIQPKFEALQQRCGGLFAQSNWQSIYGKSLELYGIFNKDNKLIGGFHLYKTVQGKVLRHYKNPPFTPHIGLFYEKNASNKANALTEQKNITQALADFFNQLPFQIFTIALAPEFTDVQHFIWKKFKVIPNYTYQLDLTQAEELLYKNLASDKRNSINKAQKDGVAVSLYQQKEAVEQMVKNTYLRKEKSLNEPVLNRLLSDYANEKNSFSFLAKVDNKDTALSFCLHDTTTAYYLLGGYNSSNKHQGAGVLALWNCILHAKKIGLKTFDFEGSMIPQVEKYFRGFGADLIPYFTINKANIALESGLKFLKRETF